MAISHNNMKTGIELISQEREEQIVKHNYSIQEDVEYNDGQQLPTAAMLLIEGGMKAEAICPSEWGKEKWIKMVNKSYKDRLVIAGALIAAEIDRLQSASEG